MNLSVLARALSAGAVLFCAASGPAQGVLRSDDFNTPTLAPFWTVLDPVGDVDVRVEGFDTGDARLVLDIPGGVPHDLWRNAADAPRVLQSFTGGDFSAEAKWESMPAQRFQFQGLVAQAAADDLVRAEFLSRGDGLYLFVARIAGSTAFPILDQRIPDAQFLRLERTADQWTVSYSADGIAYTVGVVFTDPVAVTEVGVHAGNAGSPVPSFVAEADWFFDTDAPIRDEDRIRRSVPEVLRDLHEDLRDEPLASFRGFVAKRRTLVTLRVAAVTARFAPPRVPRFFVQRLVLRTDGNRRVRDWIVRPELQRATLAVLEGVLRRLD